jgi:arylsulfatase A-like enzyme
VLIGCVQVCLRRGLCKVGAPIGLQDRDVTIAQALKPLGYATGQLGKNHRGDREAGEVRVTRPTSRIIW